MALALLAPRAAESSNLSYTGGAGRASSRVRRSPNPLRSRPFHITFRGFRRGAQYAPCSSGESASERNRKPSCYGMWCSCPLNHR